LRTAARCSSRRRSSASTVVESATPEIRYRVAGETHTLACDLIAGCDGFHGVCRDVFPPATLTTYDRVFPFGWLGVLSESPPLREMTYVNHPRGFALCSRRSPKISRHYLQVAPDENPELCPMTASGTSCA